MPDIPITCRHCGTSFSVANELGGLIAICPSCNEHVEVPIAEGQLEHKVGLRIAREKAVDGGLKCPSCGVALPEGTVFCSDCGYNLQTGFRVLRTKSKPNVVQLVSIAVGVVFLLFLAYYVLWPMLKPEPEAPAREAVAPPEPPPPPPVEPEPVEAVEEPAPVEQDPLAEQKAAEEARRAMEERLTAERKARLDRNLPLYATGEVVALRQVNGLVHRGTFVKAFEEEVVISADERVVHIPLKDLDRDSRLRVDPLFRQKFIEFYVRQEMKKAGMDPAP